MPKNIKESKDSPPKNYWNNICIYVCVCVCVCDYTIEKHKKDVLSKKKKNPIAITIEVCQIVSNFAKKWTKKI